MKKTIILVAVGALSVILISINWHKKAPQTVAVAVIKGFDTVKVTVLMKGPGYQVTYIDGYYMRDIYRTADGKLASQPSTTGTLVDTAFKAITGTPIAFNPR